MRRHRRAAIRRRGITTFINKQNLIRITLIILVILVVVRMLPVVARYHLGLDHQNDNGTNFRSELKVQGKRTTDVWNGSGRPPWLWEYRRAVEPTTAPKAVLSPLLPAAKCRAYTKQSLLVRPLPRSVTFYAIHDTKFPVTPQSGDCGSGKLVALAAVSSEPENLEARSAIRSTWGSKLHCLDGMLVSLGLSCDQLWSGLRVLFFIPIRNRKQDAAIEREAAQFDDVVYYQAVYSDQSSTVRTIATLQWITERCGNLSYVLRVQDDMFVNVVYAYDAVQNAVPENDLLIIGDFAARPVDRNASSSSYVPLSVYPNDTMPPYSNNAYFLSVRAARKLVDAAVCVPGFRSESIFLTGLLAGSLKMDKYQSDCFGCALTENPMAKCAILYSAKPDLITTFWKLLVAAPAKALTKRCTNMLVPEA